jgi:alkaline phosphatase D
MTTGRRAFLAQFAALAAALLAPGQARPKFVSYPFTLGVASGSPTADGFVLWTRLAPDPLHGGGMGEDSVEVRWEVASDEQFRQVVKQGAATASAAFAHSVHVEVGGLDPGRWYHYRFAAGSEMSPAARTRTAPAAAAADDRLRIALASCQQYEQGYFIAHRHLAADSPDLVLFVGDYIYESSWGREHVRKHASGEPKTLAEYRDRHAQYKTDPDLQAAHAAAPWIVTWDDHEVSNDYADDRGEDLTLDFPARRAAAYRAYYEHMPLRPSVLLEGGEVRIYGSHAWGGLANLLVLDDRQYRSHQACQKPLRGGSSTVGAECTERLDEKRTMLGARQEKWLSDALAQSTAAWNIVVQQTLMAPAGRDTANGMHWWTDGWDGYPAARARLLGAIADSKASNPVVLGGDVHSNWVADLHRDPERPGSPVVASEFCGTSITAQGPDAKRVAAIKAANAHIRFGEGSRRGYMLLNLMRRNLEAKLRVVDTVKRPDAGISTLASFVVEDGTPGAKIASM